MGHPALPDSTRRLRNSTWRGAHNAPHCGTDSVPGGRKLGAESESWAPVLTLMDRVSAPAPANGAALNVSTGAQCSSTSPHRVELLGAPQGGKGKRPRASAFTQSSILNPRSCLAPVTTVTPSRSSRFFPAPSTQRTAPPLVLPLPVTASRYSTVVAASVFVLRREDFSTSLDCLSFAAVT
jgi:hypothetical protein